MRVLSRQKPLGNVRHVGFARVTLDTFFENYLSGKYVMVLARYRCHNLILLVAGIVL